MGNLKENEYSPEMIAAVKEAVESSTEVEFVVFSSAYLEKNIDQPELTEIDLIFEIFRAGGYAEELILEILSPETSKKEISFEDVVMMGAFIMGEDLGLFS